MTRKELLRLMPIDGDDLTAATRIVELGYPTVTPVMRDIVRWMRVADSPVAEAFATFLGSLGEPALTEIAVGLKSDNCFSRHRILTNILPHWRLDWVRQLTNTLSMVATQPDAYDNDVTCIAILAKHRLADPEWLNTTTLRMLK